MDPLDVITNTEKIVPYYQAIFSADEQKVIGYEILGRIHMEGEYKSLGFFSMMIRSLKNTEWK